MPLVAVAAGYLLGAIPVGLLAGWLSGGVDLRRRGSGRTGTTNVLRTLGVAAAIAVLALDLAKGLVAVLLARWLVAGDAPDAQAWAAAAAGFAAVVGHNHSIFIGLRGGRGVATAAGALAALAPLALAVLAPLVVGIMAASRYVSLGSVTGAALLPVAVAPLVVLDVVHPAVLAFAVAAGALVLLAHRDNIARLRAGTERKIGQREG